MRTTVLGHIMSGMHISSAALRAVRNPFAVRMAVIKSHDRGFVMSDPAAPDSWAVQVFRWGRTRRQRLGEGGGLRARERLDRAPEAGPRACVPATPCSC